MFLALVCYNKPGMNTWYQLWINKRCFPTNYLNVFYFHTQRTMTPHRWTSKRFNTQARSFWQTCVCLRSCLGLSFTRHCVSSAWFDGFCGGRWNCSRRSERQMAKWSHKHTACSLKAYLTLKMPYNYIIEWKYFKDKLYFIFNTLLFRSCFSSEFERFDGTSYLTGCRLCDPQRH